MWSMAAAAVRVRVSFAIAICLVLFSCCCCVPTVASSSGSSGGDGGSYGAIQLTSKDFDSSIKDGNVWLVEFHAPWCGHCRHFAPSYEEVAQALHKDEEVDVKVAKVDGDAERAIRGRFGVNAFPSFYLIDGWSVYEFDGKRNVRNLIDFCKGGYKQQDARPLFSSPFGPMGLMQGWLMQAGVHVMSTYDYWINERGFSPIVLVCAMLVGGITCGVFFMIALTIALSSKPKED